MEDGWFEVFSESLVSISRILRHKPLEDSNLNYRYDNSSDPYIIFHERKCVVVRNIKVGTHEGTCRRDLFQGLVRCRVYTMGQVEGTNPLKGLHAGTCYTSKY